MNASWRGVLLSPPLLQRFTCVLARTGTPPLLASMRKSFVSSCSLRQWCLLSSSILLVASPSPSSYTGKAFFSSENTNALEELDMAQVKGIRRNMSIRDKAVRVIDDKGKSLGVLPTLEAIELAKENGLDLVEVTPATNANEAICKMMSYKMFLEYKQSLVKKRSAEKVKEVVFTSEIMEHDLQMKMRQLETFLREGYLVEVKLNVKGRHEKAKQGTDTMLMGTQLLTAVLKRLETEVTLVGLVQSTDTSASVRLRAAKTDSNTKEELKQTRRRKFLMELQLSEERIKELREKQKREEQERQQREVAAADRSSSTPSDFASSVDKKYGGITTNDNNKKGAASKKTATSSPMRNAKVNIVEPPKKKDDLPVARDENDPDNTRDLQRVQRPSPTKRK